MIHQDLRGGCEEGGRSVCSWWKSAAELDYVFETSINVSKMSPRIRLVRELERLALLSSESLNDIRHKLLSYRPGDFWVPTGGINKQDLEIPAINTILLVGFHNAGKTSLVNFMYRVLSRSALLHFAQTSSGTSDSTSTSLFMEEHNVVRSTHSGFCVYDTRGFEYTQVDEALEEVTDWMTNGVHHKKLCLLPGDNNAESDTSLSLSSGSIFATRDVNYAMVVANAWEIYTSLNLGDTTPLEALKKLFYLPALRNSSDTPPLLILTHGDKLSTEARIDSRLKICEFLGVSESSGAYDVVCVTEYGFLAESEYDPISAFAVSEAVYRGLLVSDKGHLPKQRFLDWAILVFVWLMSGLAAIFSFLARICDHFVPKNTLKFL